jgi:RNA polymerase sigma-70 factor (ECF subfamily)
VEKADFEGVIAEAVKGDQRALSRLYAGYNPMLVRYLRAQTPGYGEDLAHETWLAVTPKLRRFHGGERDFRMTLLDEARRQVAEFRRSARVAPVRPFAPHTLNGLRPITVGDATVADAALAQLLHGLRPLHAEILLLRVVGGLSAEETGALLGKSAGMVRVTQHRALRQLAQRLGTDRVAP